MKKNTTKRDNKPKIINITGSCGKTTTSTLTYLMLYHLGKKTALACSTGLWINGKKVLSKDQAKPAGYNYLYSRRNKFDFIINETPLRPPNRRLKFYPGKSNACAITNIYNDHKEHTGAATLSEIADIKSEIFDHNKLNGKIVLNADNRYLLNLAEKRKIKNLAFISLQKKFDFGDAQAIYYIKENSIFCRVNNHDKKILDEINKFQIIKKTGTKFNRYNLLMSIALIHGFLKRKKEFQKLQSLLKKLEISSRTIPGRFNIFPFKKFKLILDFALNQKGYDELFKAALNIEHERIVTVIKVPSVKSAFTIKGIAKLAGKYSDFIYIKESFSKTSPKRKMFGGKIAKKILEGVLQSGFNKNNVRIVLDEEKALSECIKNAREGDLIIYSAHRVDKILKMIKKYQKTY